MLRYLVVDAYSPEKWTTSSLPDQANRAFKLARKTGRLDRTGRGLYELPSVDATEHRTLAAAAKHVPNGVPVRFFNPAKTVADCFKYRNKIGLDVAIEALREYWKARRCKMDDLWHYTDVCRVRNVMRPYLEALAA